MQTILSAGEAMGKFCIYLDAMQWRYFADTADGGYTVVTGVNADDLAVRFVIQFDAEKEMIILLSEMPCEFKKDSRTDGAVAVSLLNRQLADGCFDYDIDVGSIVFRLTNSWKGGMVGEEVFDYMLRSAGDTIYAYNDLLLTLSKDKISLKEFYDEASKGR